MSSKYKLSCYIHGAPEPPDASRHKIRQLYGTMRTAAALVSLWGLACQHVCGFVVNTPALRTQGRSSHDAVRATSALSMKAGSNPKVRPRGRRQACPSAAVVLSRVSSTVGERWFGLIFKPG